ncbi:MAG TPA: hypothetical protein VFU92_02655 [Usitatibacter sp.]|jgi:signal transduction histidine kinase|nr:hypothetical protein [Usitatibacter sp.]
MLPLLEAPEYRVWEALDEERARLATTLNEDVARSLSALALVSRMLCDDLPESDKAMRRRARALASDVEACAGQVRTIARVLAPQRLVSLGLRAALAEFVRSLPLRDRHRVRFSGSDLPVVVALDAGAHCFAIGCDLLRVALGNSTGTIEVEISRDFEGVRMRVDLGEAGAFPVMYEMPVEMQARSLAIGARLRLTAGRTRAELFLRERKAP